MGRQLLRQFFKDWRNVLPLLIVLIFFALAIAAPVLSPPVDVRQPELNRVAGFSQTPVEPDSEHILGIYPGGFDVYHSLIWGTRSALRFGLIVAFSTAVIGIGVGALSNGLGGVFARLGMRITDAFMAFPSLAAVMLFTQVFKPGFTEPVNPLLQFFTNLNVEPVMLALILFSWMAYSRMTYVSIDQQKMQEYVLAASVIGVSNFRIFFRHILPNIVSPLIVLIAKDIGGMVILEAAFVFIGISHYTEWGQMIAVSKNWIIGPTAGFTYWWTFIPATLTLILFSLSWQILGQRINTVLNPRSFSYLK